MKNINIIMQKNALRECELVGAFERKLRVFSHTPMINIEEISEIPSHTIGYIEREGHCTSTTLAILFEPYPRCFGCKFYLSKFLDFAFRAILQCRSIKFIPLTPSQLSNIPINPSRECLLLATNPRRSFPSRIEVPYKILDYLVDRYHAEAMTNCLSFGRFEEHLRWLCGLSQEAVEDYTHIAKNTIHGVEQQCHSRCLILAELFDFYATQLHFDFSLQLFLDAIYNAVIQGKSLKAVAFDQSSECCFSGSIANEIVVLRSLIDEQNQLENERQNRINNYLIYQEIKEKFVQNRNI